MAGRFGSSETRRALFRQQLLATTAFTAACVVIANSPQSALAACAGENTANVLCNAANPATAGTLNTSFPGSTLVTINPGAAITGSANATVTAPGTLTFNHNDPAGIGGAAALLNNFGAVTFTGNGPIGGATALTVVGGGSGDVSVTANAPVTGSATGISVSNSGTGATLVTGSGSIQGGIFSAIGVSATGFGPFAPGTTGIHISGTGAISNFNNPVISAQITNSTNNANIVIDHSGPITGADGIFAKTAGTGLIVITTSSTVSAALGTGITTQVFSGGNVVNVTAGKVQGGFGGINASATGLGNSNITISSGATVSADAAFGVGVSLSGGSNAFPNTNMITNNGTISGLFGVVTSTKSTIIDNAGSISGAGGTAVLLGGPFNLFVMDGPLASLTGSAIGSGSDTFRLAGSGANSFDVSQIGAGWTSFEKTGSSVWTLTGTATYPGPATVNAGTLLVNGSLASSSGLTVNAGATVGGSGTLPKTTINGGTLSPGNSIGTIAISGSLTFVGPGTYLVEVSPTASDLTKVSSNASLAGTVQVNAVSGGIFTPKHYTILNAGSISGTFGSLVVNGNFGPAVKNPHLEYDANDVYFVLDPNAISPLLSGGTRNERAIAAAIDTALQAGVATPPFLALLNLTVAQLAGALDQLSGEAHASTAGVLVDESLYARSAVLGRLRQASYGGDSRMALLSAGGPQAFANGEELSALAYAKSPIVTKAPPLASQPGSDVVFWAQGFGARGKADGDGNAASLQRDLAGFFSGVDTRVSTDGRLGFAAGYTGSRNNLDGRGSSTVESGHVAGYGGWRFGAFNLRAGGDYAWHTIDTSRTIAFPGFFDSASAHYNGGTGQIFGEAGYGFAFGKIAVEPFAGGAWVRLHTDAFNERGGPAALAGAANNFEIGYSTVGIRAASMIPLANDMILVPRGAVAWQHAFNDVTPLETLAFRSAGVPFVIAGVPIARDSVLAEAGLDLAIGRNATVGLSYVGQAARNVHDHAAKGKFSWKF